MTRHLGACWLLGLLLCVIVPELHAQNRAVVILGYGGLHSPTVAVADGGVGLNTTSAAGAGVALQLTRNMALRGSATFSKGDIDDAALQEQGVKRVFMSGDIQIGFPNSSAVVPYLLVGVGRVSLDPDQTGEQTSKKLASRIGTGLNYIPDNSVLAFFAELSGWFYRFDALGFDRHQFDILLTAGIAYAIPF